MGMRENPSSGYVLEADKLKHLLRNSDLVAQFEQMVEQREWEALVEFCDIELPLTVPRPESFFMLGDDDTGDGDLEHDVLYAYFDEDDLFKRKKNAKMLELENLLGVGPELHCWTMFG